MYRLLFQKQIVLRLMNQKEKFEITKYLKKRKLISIFVDVISRDTNG